MPILCGWTPINVWPCLRELFVEGVSISLLVIVDFFPMTSRLMLLCP